MIAIFFKSFMLFGVLSWYSAGIWDIINDYFRAEFQTYIKDDLYRLKTGKIENNGKNLKLNTDYDDNDVGRCSEIIRKKNQDNNIDQRNKLTGNYNPNIISVEKSMENPLKSKFNYQPENRMNVNKNVLKKDDDDDDGNLHSDYHDSRGGGGGNGGYIEKHANFGGSETDADATKVAASTWNTTMIAPSTVAKENCNYVSDEKGKQKWEKLTEKNCKQRTRQRDSFVAHDDDSVAVVDDDDGDDDNGVTDCDDIFYEDNWIEFWLNKKSEKTNLNERNYDDGFCVIPNKDDK